MKSEQLALRHTSSARRGDTILASGLCVVLPAVALVAVDAWIWLDGPTKAKGSFETMNIIVRASEQCTWRGREGAVQRARPASLSITVPRAVLVGVLCVVVVAAPRVIPMVVAGVGRGIGAVAEVVLTDTAVGGGEKKNAGARGRSVAAAKIDVHLLHLRFHPTPPLRARPPYGPRSTHNPASRSKFQSIAGVRARIRNGIGCIPHRSLVSHETKNLTEAKFTPILPPKMPEGPK
ncbi:hypothetical protein K438DRAFT_1941772 [Mycena galopus ATCC 62051]|nr:hypothetical protein K438DRAFT_1941772 [Mycena galopus ATCC 62051]